MIGDRLAGARQNERSACDNRAQKNLQTAVAADIVERTPHDGLGFRWRRDRRGEAAEAVHHHLRHAGRARRQQHPFGRNPIRRVLRDRHEIWRADDHDGNACESLRRLAIDHDGIDVGVRHQRAKMPALDIRRQDSEAAGNPIKLDQRQSARELACGRNQNRTSAQFGEAAAEAAAGKESGEVERERRDRKRTGQPARCRCDGAARAPQRAPFS